MVVFDVWSSPMCGTQESRIHPHPSYCTSADHQRGASNRPNSTPWVYQLFLIFSKAIALIPPRNPQLNYSTSINKADLACNLLGFGMKTVESCLAAIRCEAFTLLACKALANRNIFIFSI